MDRREAVKLLALSTALPSMPVELLAAFREIHAGLSTDYALKAFSPHQDATVAAMADLIIPTTGTPGAKAVRVNEFIDHIVADWYSEEDRRRFLNGLADVDARAQDRFQKNFVDALPAQQSEILRVLGEELTRATAALASAPRGYRGSAPKPGDSFYFLFRQLTLTGYFTSEAGFTQQLREEIIPGHYDGCVPVPPAEETKGP